MIAWDESVSSGIEEIDLQHKEFFKIIQRLQILNDKGSGKDFTLRILQELVKYTEYHFISEENLMILTKYPSIEHHQLEHKKLLRSLNYWIQAFEDGNEKLAALLSFLASWLTSHTKSEDCRIGEYLNSRP